jgi:hypothetical protein
MDSTIESKKRFKQNRSTLYWIILIIVLFAIVLLVDRFYQKEFNRFDSVRISAKGTIEGNNSISCQVVRSTQQYDAMLPWQYDLPKFEIKDIDTDTPKLSFDGNTWTDLQKIYDEHGYLTVQTEPTWNMDNIGINKESGTFVRTMHGINGEEQYAIAQKGWCE